MVCDSCGRDVCGCNIVNGMKFCAKCYQETFGNQQNKESNELLVNSLAEKDRQITELKKQLEEKEKTIQGLIEAQKYLEESASYQMFLDIQKQLEEKKKEIEKLREWLSQCEADRKSEQEKKNLAFKQLRKRSEQLKSQPAEIVEKIRKSIHYYPISLLDGDNEPRIKTLGISKEVLDNLLQEYKN